MKKTLGYLTFLASAAFALPVGAVTWTWDLHNADSTPSCQTSQSCTIALPGSPNDLKLHAYSNSAWAGGGAAGPIGMGTRNANPVDGSGGLINSTGWMAADNVLYGTSGFGIKNNVQTQLSEEESSPQHATDNAEVLDIMVIEMPDIQPGQVWDFQNMALGWAQTAGLGNSAEVSVFVGGANLGAGHDFSGVCFDAAFGGSCRAGETALSTLGGGFSNITNAINSGNALAAGTSYNVSGTNTGNYIIMAGRLGDKDDAFKLKGITASTVKVPEPATVALLGLGLFGLAVGRRRAAKA